MADLKFPRCMKAGRAVDLDQWGLADALLTECDDKEGGARGYNAVCSEFASYLGIEYEPRYLRMLRQVAEVFPKARRYDGEHNKPMVVLRAHVASGNPDMLDAIVKSGRKDGKRLSKEYIEAVLRRIRQEERERAEQEYEAAQMALDEAKAEAEQAKNRRLNATTKEDREHAARERDKAHERVRQRRDDLDKVRTAPKRKDLPAPKAEEVPTLLAKTRFMSDTASIKATLKQIQRDIEPLIPELSETFIAAGIEDLLEIANMARAVADALRKATKNKRGHLHVAS